jgi:hypothetical protein
MKQTLFGSCSELDVRVRRAGELALALAFCTLLISAPGWAQREEIGQGVRLPVRLDETISTKNHYFGPIIQSTLDQDIRDSRGRVILPAGSTVKLAMAELKRAGHMVGRARLRLRLFSVVLPDGTEAPLDGYPTRIEGGPKPGREGTFHGHRRFFKDGAIESSVILVGAGAGFAVGGPWGLPAGAAAGLLTAGIYFVARRGPDLVLPAGTVIEFTLDRPAGVDEPNADPPRLSSSSYAPDPPAPPDPPPSTTSSRAYAPAAYSEGAVWGQGLAVPPSGDLVSLLNDVNNPEAVLAMLHHLDFRNRSDSDRVFATYLHGLCDLKLSKSKEGLQELEKAYAGAKRLSFPEPAQAEIARNLVLALKESSNSWATNPLMNDPQLQAALVEPE